MITLEDFKKLEIKIGTITHAKRVPDTDKLIKLVIDFGTETREIITGMAEHYTPEEFVSKQVPILTNLEPKEMRGETSHGMMLAADVEGKPILLHPAHEVPPGSKIQ